MAGLVVGQSAANVDPPITLGGANRIDSQTSETHPGPGLIRTRHAQESGGDRANGSAKSDTGRTFAGRKKIDGAPKQWA